MTARHISIRGFALLPLLCAQAVFAVDPPKWGGPGKTEMPLQQAPSSKLAPQGPKAELEFYAVTHTMTASFAGVPASFDITGVNVSMGFGQDLVMTPSSALSVVVSTTNSSRNAAPPGTYRVRFNVSNVGWETPFTLKSDNGGQNTTCTLARKPGYTNIQSCDLVVTTSGQPFGVAASFSGTAPQLNVKSVQVFKEK